LRKRAKIELGAARGVSRKTSATKKEITKDEPEPTSSPVQDSSEPTSSSIPKPQAQYSIGPFLGPWINNPTGSQKVKNGKSLEATKICFGSFKAFEGLWEYRNRVRHGCLLLLDLFGALESSRE
jgi:hypothetical protein